MPSDLVGTRIYRPDQGGVRGRAGPRLRQLPARRRDQPRAGQGPVRAPRGHAGAPGHDRPRHLQGPDPVPRPGHREPDRGRGHLSRCPRPRSTGSCSRSCSTTRTRPTRRRSSPARWSTAAAPREILDAAGLLRLQQTVTEVYVDPRLISYAVALVEATRKLTYWGAPDLETYVSYGASPRGSINLIHGARAMALLHGRRYVLPSDIIALAPDVLRHRLVLSYAALADGHHRRHHRQARPLARPGAAPRDGDGADRMTSPRRRPRRGRRRAADLGPRRIGGRTDRGRPAPARSPTASSASSS